MKAIEEQGENIVKAFRFENNQKTIEDVIRSVISKRELLMK